MAQLVEKVRQACLARGASGIKGLGRTFRIYDDNRSRSLDIEEFAKGLHDYGVSMSDAEVIELFSFFDKDKSGTLSFDEFLSALRGPMSKARLKLIDQAFKILDQTGDGVVSVDDLKSKYDYKKHPKYMSGEYTAKQVFQEFLNSFQQDGDDKVTKEEFLNYYAGVSASIDQDIYFDYMMRQAWKL